MCGVGAKLLMGGEGMMEGVTMSASLPILNCSRVYKTTKAGAKVSLYNARIGGGRRVGMSVKKRGSCDDITSYIQTNRYHGGVGNIGGSQRA